jgi:hypothetical protein
MGFHSVQTYTLPEEGGASMRTAGFQFAGKSGGGDWNRESKPNRRTDQPMNVKHKWVRTLFQPKAQERGEDDFFA